MPGTETQPVETYVAAREDALLVEALRAGDEAAFAAIVGRYGAVMLRVARLYVPTRAVAEEVVQEAWLGVLTGIERFEGRASFKTWLFRILTNVAKTRAEREGRSTPFSSLAQTELGADEGAVDPDRFIPQGERWASYWASTPRPFNEIPEQKLLSSETVAVVQRAIQALPEVQRAVITMRDVAGFETEDVCDALQLSEGNQRVLLHRARSKVRQALELHFEEAEAPWPRS
jgi:RNA polymerase sigma-70 factor (ECF subfamily)